jgi:threonine dehydrogenase-like Zn-dependent dehydrogenase
VLTEIMSVTHGVETAQTLLGVIGGSRFAQSIAVLGVGPLGWCHLIKAKLLGAGKLIATDRFASRLALAEAFGASLTMSVETTETAERIARAREHTGGIGPDIVLDCRRFPLGDACKVEVFGTKCPEECRFLWPPASEQALRL